MQDSRQRIEEPYLTGMKFRDFIPPGERPALQRFAEMTAAAYDCGCLWPNCKGTAIKAHVVSRNWMKAITTNGKVQEFYRPSQNYLSRDVRFADTPRGRRPARFDPILRDSGNTQCYPFLCHDHDVRFNYVDNLTESRDYSLRNLNWVVYRSVLAQEWRVRSLKWALAESRVIDSKLHNASSTDYLRTNIRFTLNESLRGLDYYKRNLQSCLEPQNCAKCNSRRCSFVTHTVLPLKGKPKLASCTFSLGLRDHENWGLTVIPLADRKGHDVIWHHFAEHQKVTEKRIACQKHAQGRKRQELVSQCILRLADALVVNPEWWQAIGEKRRKAIVEFVSAETGVAIGTHEQVSFRLNRAEAPILNLRNPRQLNLFRDD